MSTETMMIGELPVQFETGSWAQQGNGLILRCREALILVTAVAERSEATVDFFPLSIDYRERMAAAGKVPGAFGRREGKASDEEILSGRLIDRSLRPLFAAGFRCETQLTATVFSADASLDHATLAINACSLALCLSDIPWDGPVCGLRVSRVDGRFLSFAAPEARQRAELDLVVTVGDAGVLMVEGDANECSEAELVEALLFAQRVAQPVLAAQKAWRKREGAANRALPPREELSTTAAEHLESYSGAMEQALSEPLKAKRREALGSLARQVLAELMERGSGATLAKAAFDKKLKSVARAMILDGRRMDGRRRDELRRIRCVVDVLPSSHGSAFFERGETQALATTTLGGPRDSLRSDGMVEARESHFFLHYAFPSYSVGEVKPSRGPGRREIGHGMLAQRALAKVIPDRSQFPYTIRVTSDILSSNGSSSMASVCAGSLSLMAAGVPLRAPVAGIAMGLVKEAERSAVLTDILGDEDHLGDMDFKVAGTRAGVTALQMDLKVDGLSRGLLEQALEQARVARLQLLDEMAKVLPAPRQQVSDKAQKVALMRTRRERIGDIIGPGGQTIRYLSESTGASIDIDDRGQIRIAAAERKSLEKAQRKLRLMLREPVVNEVVPATIIRTGTGFVRLELFPGTEASMHISQAIDAHSRRIEEELEPGQVIMVRIMGVDDRGNIKVSRRAASAAGAEES
ncbi:MAG: polyribonucleotide nucleotidyltransferase [Myxococcota bacterium]|nr:polyribonucleotide nucleotidyltransferase [Myxococcota bacterium]